MSKNILIKNGWLQVVAPIMDKLKMNVSQFSIEAGLNVGAVYNWSIRKCVPNIDSVMTVIDVYDVQDEDILPLDIAEDIYGNWTPKGQPKKRTRPEHRKFRPERRTDKHKMHEEPKKLDIQGEIAAGRIHVIGPDEQLRKKQQADYLRWRIDVDLGGDVLCM